MKNALFLGVGIFYSLFVVSDAAAKAKAVAVTTSSVPAASSAPAAASSTAPSTPSAPMTTFSAAWKASWPSSDQSKPVAMPAAWLADFNTIVFSGTATAPLVPSADVGKNNANFCDWSYNLCNATTDIVQCSAPLQWGLTFDDGPIAPQSETLYDFLAAQNQKATHFMIGTNIVQWPELVLKAFQQGDQIAVHTWTHHAMTTLDSQTAYAELRYGVEIIKNITGYTPLHWRPPYGDVDDRIRAIATHLKLTTNIWNQDTNDWCIDDTTAAADGCGNFVADSVHTNLELWSTNQKTAPHGVVCLEHELSNGSVAQFIEAYPTMKANGWNIMPVATCNNVPFYQESLASSSSSSAPSTSAAATSAPAAASSGAGAGSTAAAAASTTAASSSAVTLKYGAASAAMVAFAAFAQYIL